MRTTVPTTESTFLSLDSTSGPTLGIDVTSRDRAEGRVGRGV